MKIKVLDQSGKKVSDIEVADSVFGAERNEALIHEVAVAQANNARQGTKSTLTRSEVRGHAAKPYRQKGTGRARQGSTRSPQWTGGGVVFAPKARDYSLKLNKKLKRLALKSALSAKVRDGKLIVMESLKFDNIKTKDMVQVCRNIKTDNALVVLDSVDKNVILSARNIPGLKTAGVNTINVYDILKHDTFVVTKEAVSQIREVYA